MLDRLTALPSDIRGRIRRLEISSASLQLMHEYQDDEIYYRVAQILKLVPDLNLDLLTVWGDVGNEVNYDTLNILIRHGGGWKELHFVHLDSEFLAYKDTFSSLGLSDLGNRYLRQPQPSGWQRVLEQRHGEASEPSVVIYRSKNASSCPAVCVFDSKQRDTFSQHFAPGQTAETFGKDEDAFLMRPEERGKEVLVVVKRGAGVEYAEKEEPEDLPEDVGDIREHFELRTWAEIKAKQDELEGECDEDLNAVMEEE